VLEIVKRKAIVASILPMSDSADLAEPSGDLRAQASVLDARGMIRALPAWVG